MSERGEVSEHVCALDYKDPESIPVLELMEDLREALSHIPPEFHGNARMKIGLRLGDDAYVDGLKVTYERPETDDEVAARERAVQGVNDAARRREIAVLRQLQAKYGVNPDANA